MIVRLPGTMPDFYRQRIRIEMGKCSRARLPDLAPRGQSAAALVPRFAKLSFVELARLAVYLMLAEARTRWRRRR